MGVHFEVDASELMAELDRLIAGPDPMHFESAMLAGFMTTSAQVHVITGRLKASGHTESTFDEGRWEGTISFARHPGIFELARGDTPTYNHPEGEHFFFDPGGQEFLDGVQHALDDFIRDGGS